MTIGDALMILSKAQGKATSEFTDYELRTYLAFKSYEGSCLSWRDSLANADRHMMDRDKAIRLFK